MRVRVQNGFSVWVIDGEGDVTAGRSWVVTRERGTRWKGALRFGFDFEGVMVAFELCGKRGCPVGVLWMESLV